MRAPAAPQPRTDLAALLAEAETALRLKNPATAEAIYRLVLGQDPDCAAAHRGLGAICFGSSRREEGLAHLERAAATTPDDPAARSTLANAYAALGRFAAGAAEARAALALLPHAELHHLLGRILRDGGWVADARTEFVAALALDARHAASAHALARILEDEGEIEAAIEAWRLVVSLEPQRAGIHYRLGRLLRGRDDAAAAQSFGEAVRLDPAHADALAELGSIHLQGNDRATAIALYRRALAAKPGLAEAAVKLSAALLATDAAAEAKQAAETALAAKPDSMAARMALGRAEMALGAPAAALAAFEAVGAAHPEEDDALFLASAAAFESGDARRAIVLLQPLLLRKPELSEAWANLGAALSQEGLMADAEAAIRRAVALDPGRAGYRQNLGALLSQLGRAAEALAAYDEAVRLAPDDGNAHLDRSQQLLRVGRFAEGWREYEWRWRAARFAWRRRRDVAPAWDGKAPGGKRILLQWEQGFGDTIQFARYALPLAAAGARLVAEVQPALVRLLQAMPAFEAVVVSDGELPPVDSQARLMSLPYLLGTTLETVPAPIPYLAAPDADRSRWQAALADCPRPLAGLVWQGHAKHPNDRRRSIPIDRLAPAFAGYPGGLVSLQQGEVRAQIAGGPLADRLLDPFARIHPSRDRFLDFADTAGLIAELDLVVAVDTAVAHLAGALGKPCFLLLPAVGDARWLLERADSPWYPTFLLFRQPHDGDWDTPLARLSEALAQFGHSTAKGRS
jgi:protein O-GlcNAc transferase